MYYYCINQEIVLLDMQLLSKQLNDLKDKRLWSINDLCALMNINWRTVKNILVPSKRCSYKTARKIKAFIKQRSKGA